MQGAGMVARGRKGGARRKRREGRPLPGMLLHIDGSRHQWFQDERWYDLIVILDDATSEIYYAQLVEEESTVTVLAGLKEVIERQGVFCALYSDRGSHFWLTPKAGEAVDPHRLTQGGRVITSKAISKGVLFKAFGQRYQLGSHSSSRRRIPELSRHHGGKQIPCHTKEPYCASGGDEQTRPANQH